jgi:hypothetical protein
VPAWRGSSPHVCYAARAETLQEIARRWTDAGLDGNRKPVVSLARGVRAFRATRDEASTGFEGQLDEVALSDRALDADEIAVHLRAARGR